MIHGVINVYKEKGYTSHDVVAKLRGILKQKKIGHTGTLDPDATGVLPVCLGKATKLCDMLTDTDKVYETVLLLGKTTDTQDITGKVLEEKEVLITEEEAQKAVLDFMGEYQQIPPMYSALKVNGKKLYELAREGKEIERQSRTVQIYEIEIHDIDLPRIRMSVKCSKGTYIRTLCHDIGEILSCGGCMESLIRKQVGRFVLSDSLKLEEIERLRDEEILSQHVISIDQMFEQLPKIVIAEKFNILIFNGNPFFEEHIKEIEPSAESKKEYRVYSESGSFIGVYEWDEKRERYQPVKIFLENESESK